MISKQIAAFFCQVSFSALQLLDSLMLIGHYLILSADAESFLF